MSSDRAARDPDGSCCAASPPEPPLRVGEAVLDLVAGIRCLGCARPGALVCRGCAAALPCAAAPAPPDPSPPDLATTWACASYEGVVASMVVGHKERRQVSLRPHLAAMLAVSVAAAAPAGPVLLVPVPSRRAVVRARGHDPLDALVRLSARRLRRAGRTVRVARLLASRGPVADQAGLDRASRAANVAGSLWCPGRRGLPRAVAGSRLVVCDDVVTTGATLAEAQRALAAVGLPTAAHAVVAATPRRHPPATTGSFVGEHLPW